DFSLASFFVLVDREGWGVCRQTLDSGRQFFLLSLRVRLNGHRDHWFWEFHGFQDDRSIFRREAVTGGAVLETNYSVDMACLCFVNRVFLVGVHLEQFRNAFLLLLGCVQNLVAGFDLSGVHTNVSERTEERVRGNLEGQCGEWLIKAWLTSQFLLWVIDCKTFDGLNVQRGWQIVNNSINDRLDTTVLESGTTEYWVSFVGDGQSTDTGFNLIVGEVAFIEVLHHQFF